MNKEVRVWLKAIFDVGLVTTFFPLIVLGMDDHKPWMVGIGFAEMVTIVWLIFRRRNQ